MTLSFTPGPAPARSRKGGSFWPLLTLITHQHSSLKLLTVWQHPLVHPFMRLHAP
jgi:hypothetical protein